MAETETPFRTDVHELSDRELVARFVAAVDAIADVADRLEETLDEERLGRLRERIEALGYDYGAPRGRLSLVEAEEGDDDA